MEFSEATLGSICTFDGKQIDADIWDGKRSFNFQAPVSRQPARLGPSFWALWKEALYVTFTTPNSRTLRQPILSWCPNVRSCTKWFFESQSDQLLRNCNQHWQVWIPDSRRWLRRTTRRYKPSDLYLPMSDPRWQPALVHILNESHVLITGVADIAAVNTPDSTSLWEQILTDTDTSCDSWMTQDVIISSNQAPSIAANSI